MKKHDTWAKPIIEFLTQPRGTVPAKLRHYMIDKEILWRRIPTSTGLVWTYVIPAPLRLLAISLCHDTLTGGHFGLKRTYERVRQHFYFRKMVKHICNYVEQCQKCQMTKVPRSKNPSHFRSLPLVTRPFERVGMDLVGPLKMSTDGNSYILCAVDYMTRYAEAFPIRNKDGNTVF